MDAFDEGQYRCVAKNPAGVSYSEWASVSLATAPTTVEVFPSDQSVDVGSNVTLSCVAADGNPKPTIRWIKLDEYAWQSQQTETLEFNK